MSEFERPTALGEGGGKLGVTARIGRHRSLLAIIGLVGITAGVWLS